MLELERNVNFGAIMVQWEHQTSEKYMTYFSCELGFVEKLNQYNSLVTVSY